MSIIKVKRSGNKGTPDVGTLKQGELAYSLLNDNPDGGNTLYVGTTDGVDSIAIPVGGKKFTDLLTATPGTVASNKAIIAGTSGALSSITIGDGTTNSTLTNTSLTLTASGLNVIGGNVVFNSESTEQTPTAFTITGLPAPDQNSPNDQVATKGYVTSVATGINVSDAEDPPNTGNIAGADVFKFAGAQGVTTLYNNATETMTIGLQQQLDVDDDVAFGSVTVGDGIQEVLLDNNVIKQLHPSIYHQFDSTAFSLSTNKFNRSTSAFEIQNHGFEDNEAVTYTSNQQITGFTAGTTYYVVRIDDDSFKLSASSSEPRTPISSPDDQGGTTTDVLQSASNPVNLFSTSDVVNIGSTINSTVAIGDNLTVGGNTVIAGNLIVSGETTTVNSTVMQIDDPVLELGEGTVNDAFDRGIKFHYHDGTTADKIGFMGYDKDQGNFTLLTDATDSSQSFAGTTGTLVANLTGNVTGNATTTTGFDSSVLTQNDIDGLGGTTAVAGRQITLSGAVSSGAYATPGDTNSVFTAGPITWDGTGNLTIYTQLTDDVSTMLGNYVESVNTIAQDATNPKGSSIIIDSLNNDPNGQQATVDVRSATEQASAPEIDPAAQVDGVDTHTDNWKDTQGVASFDSAQFDVTNGWVHISTIDGGTYGTP